MIFDMGRRQPFFEDLKLITATEPCAHRFTAHYGYSLDHQARVIEVRICGSCGSLIAAQFVSGVRRC